MSRPPKGIVHYIIACMRSCIEIILHQYARVTGLFAEHNRIEKVFLIGTLCSTLIMGMVFLSHGRSFYDLQLPLDLHPVKKIKPIKKTAGTFFNPKTIDLNPVREEPPSFNNGFRMPKGSREYDHSLHIDKVKFNPGTDLITIHNHKVWWESDHDGDGHDEDDHKMHRSMEEPFKRLVHLIELESKKHSRGVVLKVQDSYRAEGVHHAKSLHKQGRALDLTTGIPSELKGPGLPKEKTPGIPLSKLGKLCWAAGFDWVLYETHHIHVSCKP